MERAAFWQRGLAVALDVLIGGVAVILSVVVLIVVAAPMWDVPEQREDYLIGIALPALALLYTSTEVWFAATPGKLIMRLRIGTAAGTPAGKWTLALRWSSKYFGWFLALIHAVTLDPATYFLSGWSNLVVVVGCLQATDEHRRAWHDEWAGTAVLRRSRPPFGGGTATPPPLP